MIEEKNKLIAEFLELAKCQHKCKDKCGSYKCLDGMHHTLKDMKFTTSWEWILPAVIKCKQLGEENKDAMASLIYNHPVMSLTTCDIQKVYDAVINAIGYHNLVNPQTP